MTHYAIATVLVAAAASFASSAFAGGSTVSHFVAGASANGAREATAAQVAPRVTQAAAEFLIARRNGTLRPAGEADQANLSVPELSTTNRQQVKRETVQASLSRTLIPAGEGVDPIAAAKYGEERTRVQVKDETRVALRNGMLAPAGRPPEGPGWTLAGGIKAGSAR